MNADSENYRTVAFPILTSDADHNQILLYTLYFMVNLKKTKHNAGYLPVIPATNFPGLTSSLSRYLRRGTSYFFTPSVFVCIKQSRKGREKKDCASIIFGII